jgi:hypothetical protein
LTKPRPVAKPACDPLELLRLRLGIPVFTEGSVCVGVGAHIAAGASAPSAAMVLLLAAAVGLTSSSLLRCERGPLWIGLAVALVQLAMHVALLAGHEYAIPAATEYRPTTLLAHAGAVVALTWWLRRGEAAAWGAAVKVWRRPVRPPHVVVIARLYVRYRPGPWCRARFCGAPGSVLPVRGPPG